MKVSELGEFGLIDRLAGALAAQWSGAPAERLAIGIGDDAAVWRSGDGAIVATTDTLLAGVHFLPERTPWADLGWKALAVNVSDIAAMGGTPEFALVTLGLPEDTEAERVDELYHGLAEASEAYSVVIAGGDVVRAPQLMISVALIGHAELDERGEPRALRRNAAEAGDLVAVTGWLGGAAGGLRLLREDGAGHDAAAQLVRRHLRPQARLRQGQAALAAGLRCAIDVSDGLLQDLGHICRASSLAAVVWRDKLPIDPALEQLFEPEVALRYACSGGEDYELILVGGQAQIDAAGRAGDTPVTVIGEIVIDAKPGAKLLDEAGRELPTPTPGWDHLRQG